MKLENVLLKPDANGKLTVKIIDFGFSIWMSNKYKEKMFCGTSSYMAPELLLRTPYHPGPADIWATGVLTYLLLCGRFPYRGKTDRELLQLMKRGEIRYPSWLSKQCTSLLRSMLKVHPKQRITVTQIMKQDWIAERETETFDKAVQTPCKIKRSSGPNGQGDAPTTIVNQHGVITNIINSHNNIFITK